MTTRRPRGFTFTEIMIVAVLLAVIAGLALPRLLATVSYSRRTEAEANLEDIRNAQLRYFQDHQTYATDAQRGQLGLSAWPGGTFAYAIDHASAANFRASATGLGTTIYICRDVQPTTTAPDCP